MKRLVVASTNPGKVREIRAIIGSALGGSARGSKDGWQVDPLPPQLPDVEEDGETFLENAVKKAELYGARLGGWTLADDSGLEVDALNGRPGIHSARYAPTDPERIDRLLGELEGIPEPERGARFVCALALAADGKRVWSTLEWVEGRIALASTGQNGFGYDPVFWVPELGRMMAELDPVTKNQISHRGRALTRLIEHLRTL